METVKSRSGYEIIMICAACEHKTYFANGKDGIKRRCKITKKQVEARDTCNNCKVNNKLLAL